MMSLRHKSVVVVLVAAMGGAVSCAPEKPSTEELRGTANHRKSPRASAEIDQRPVVVVNGEEVSLAEFERRIEALPEPARARFSSVGQKQKLLDQVAQFEVMADVAERRHRAAGADLGDRQVLTSIKTALADRLVEQVMDRHTAIDEISDAAVQAFYEAHPQRYRTPAGRRVAVIKAHTRAQAERMRTRVTAAIDQAIDTSSTEANAGGEAPDQADAKSSDQSDAPEPEAAAASRRPVNVFRRAAATYSVDRSSASSGGDLGFIQPPPVGQPSAIARHVFKLDEQGQVTPVFAVDDGFVLATFFDERRARTVPLEDVSAQIRATLVKRGKRQAKRRFVDKLRKQAAVERHPGVVDRINAPPAPGARRIDDIPVDSAAPADRR